jgi:hypothetical protein
MRKAKVRAVVSCPVIIYTVQARGHLSGQLCSRLYLLCGSFTLSIYRVTALRHNFQHGRPSSSSFG